MEAPAAPAIRMDIGGFATRPWLRLGPEVLVVNEGILRGYGFDDYRLTEDLFRVLVALAAARKRGVEQSLCAEVLAERVCSTPGRVTGLLARALRDPAHRGQPSEGALVRYMVKESKGGGYTGGRSVGPYWLNLPMHRIMIDLDESDAFLRGKTVREIVLNKELFGILQEASDIAGEGAFMKSVSLIRAAIRAARAGKDDAIRRIEDRTLFEAKALEHLANFQMELGLWEEGLASANRALELYGEKKHGNKRRTGHPEGRAHVLQIKAHLFGQAGDKINAERALYAAEAAVAVLENSGNAEARKGMRRALFRGVLGQRYSQAGRFHKAIRPLADARRVAAEEGATRWEAIWSVRIAQNAVLLRDISTAENELSRAIDLSDHMTVAGNAALCRARAELFIAAGSWSAAEEALLEAQTFGAKFGMAHQQREIERLWVTLRNARSR
ncbi:MAG: hypothetical protein IT372_28810 [Polyangiaceae bacterium]|nr:hypothetical protein [Polyangiaceae bacterium]